MVGERMRQARQAAGLTLDEVVERLSAAGQSITKAGLSKYEKNKSTPNAAFLLKLGQALSVKSSFFLREARVDVEWVAFRKQACLTKSRQNHIKASMVNRVEEQMWLQDVLNIEQVTKLPPVMPGRTPQEAEAAAEALRHAWGMGDLPIESVTQIAEDRGCIVVGMEADEGHCDGLSGKINGKIPLICCNLSVEADRRRFNLAHELGHLLMDSEDLLPKEVERLAHRFAASFIVPRQIALRELGTRRRHLDFKELGLLKLKYGLSMQAWYRRAFDLGIIDEGHFRSLSITFSARGWRKREPIVYEGNEEPTRLKQMVLRALAEGIISEARAEQLCPGCVHDLEGMLKPTTSRYPTASELLKLPLAERDRILARAASEAADVYRSDPDLTNFEAMDEEDLHDGTAAESR